MPRQEFFNHSKQPILNVLRESAIAGFLATRSSRIDPNDEAPHTLMTAVNDAVLGSGIDIVELASKLADPAASTDCLPYELAIAYSRRVEVDPTTSLQEVSLDFARKRVLDEVIKSRPEIETQRSRNFGIPQPRD